MSARYVQRSYFCQTPAGLSFLFQYDSVSLSEALMLQLFAANDYCYGFVACEVTDSGAC